MREFIARHVVSALIRYRLYCFAVRIPYYKTVKMVPDDTAEIVI